MFSIEGLLGGSWVVISGATLRVTIVITHVKGLITLLMTTHEPPSRVQGARLGGLSQRAPSLNHPRTRYP